MTEELPVCEGCGEVPKLFDVCDAPGFERIKELKAKLLEVEYEGAGSPEKAQKMLAKSMDGLFKRRSYPGRGYHMRNKEFHIKDLVVDDKYGTVLVGLCFVSFVVPTF